jgi:hypothetical protein
LLVHDLEQFPDGFPRLTVRTRRVTLGSRGHAFARGRHRGERQPPALRAPSLLPGTLVFAVAVDVCTTPSRCLFARRFSRQARLHVR